MGKIASKQIDYRPLEVIDNAWSAIMRTVFKGWGWPLGVLTLIAGIFLIIMTTDPRWLLVPLLYFGYIGGLVSMRIEKGWSGFAAANGWHIDRTKSVVDKLPPSLKFGQDPDLSPVIKADLGGLACNLFSYGCTTKSDDSKSTYYFTIAIIQLPKPMPHIMLRNKKSRTDARNDIPDVKTLRLEGNFNDYFELKVQEHHEVDALAIITPDVMQTLIDYSKGEDIEMLGQTLYFIINDDSRGSSSIKQLVQSVIGLGHELEENIRLATPRLPQESRNYQAKPASTQPMVTATNR